MRNLRVFFGNPPIPIIKLWKNALSQSTEGIFLLYLITSIVVESVRNNSLTYSWIEVFLMVITASTIRRYYKRHRYIYLMVFDNMAQRLERYMAMPYMEDKSAIITKRRKYSGSVYCIKVMIGNKKRNFV